MLSLIQKIFGDPVKKEITKLQKIVDQINKIEVDLQNKTDQEIKDLPNVLKQRLSKGETLDELLPEAFATVKNVCRRLCGTKIKVFSQEEEWNMIPYDVQIIGAIVLHKGKIAEMKTGEGKTLVSTMPVFLNALEEKGVHVVTVNDFLAQRDAQWMKAIFEFLGMTVGIITHDLPPSERKAAYNCDITYATNNELGFDFLRDSMAQSLDQMVQRSLHFAIVDEVDSILIDEARTPLIISQPAEESTNKYLEYSRLISSLEENLHFNIDEKQKTAVLSEEGIAKMESLLGVNNIFTDKGITEVHHIEQALRAKACYEKDVDYVVKDGEVIIVDEFTGRLMPGRRYSEGLHQAIEAKEGVKIRRESKTMATITFQNYFRMYQKLAGMTGTALTEAEEFAKIYALEVLPIPTHKEVIRQDHADLIFKNEKGKFQAIAKVVQEKYEKGQPVLIGTISIDKSEKLSQILQNSNIPHSVLNAKHHAKEAEIIAKAGQKKAVTIATNMAGRGTDIKLGEEVSSLGGLCIIGSERHESRRIDNQLRGRSGRQGDSGESQFFVSLDDPLMRLFGSERLQKIMSTLKVPSDMPIESKMVSGTIESAQKKVEGRNFDIRKHLVEFDDVTNRHREIIAKRRRKILENEDLHSDILKMIENIALEIVQINTSGKIHQWDKKELYETVSTIHKNDQKFNLEIIKDLENRKEIENIIIEFLQNSLEEKILAIGSKEKFAEIERFILLKTIDALWPEHINDMSHLREVVSLRGFAQRDPLMEFKQEGFTRFKKLLAQIEDEALRALFSIKIEITLPQEKKVTKNIITNENQIENSLLENFQSSDESSVMPNERIKVDNSQIKNMSKVGRNESCPCGSGKKFKKCCGK